MVNLFQLGDFTLASGKKSKWKIECDALTNKDWEAIAAMAIELLNLPILHEVVGVPRGGVPFAEAMKKYESLRDPSSGVCRVLFCEDVVTTGRSIEEFSENWVAEQIMKDESQRTFYQFEVMGVCLFARGKTPSWVHPLFRMPGA